MGSLMKNFYRTSRSTLVMRNITVSGHRTSIRLEPEMWVALRDIALQEATSVNQLCSHVAQGKNQHTSLTAAIRVYVMNYYRTALAQNGMFAIGSWDKTHILEDEACYS